MSANELSPSDRQEIGHLIAQQRPGRMGEIVSLQIQGSDLVIVHTGISRSEHSGIGYIFHATKSDGRWMVKEVDMWQA